MLKSASYVNNFVNSIVKCGKRARAYKFYHNTLAYLKFQVAASPVTLIENSFVKLKPIIRVVPFKRGARARHLPLETSPSKQRCSVIKWLLRSAKESSKNLSVSLANVIVKTTQDKGSAIVKKHGYYQLGLQNKRTLKSLKFWRKRNLKKKRRKTFRNIRGKKKRLEWLRARVNQFQNFL